MIVANPYDDAGDAYDTAGTYDGEDPVPAFRFRYALAEAVSGALESDQEAAR